MSKVTYTEYLNGAPQFVYSGNLVFQDGGRNSAVFDDLSGANFIEFGGKLKYTFAGDLKGGTVDEMSFLDANGNVMIRVVDVSFNAKRLATSLENSSTISDFLSVVHAGKDAFVGTDDNDGIASYGGGDRINAKGGDDLINAGNGNDRITGGSGSDQFIFTGKFGKDVITDFDAVGGGHDQDYISATIGDVKSVNRHGDDTVIIFFGGHQVTLLDVDRKDVSPEDFG